MKHTRWLTLAVVGLMTGAAGAQMQGGHGGMQGGEQHEGMDTQQSQQMMGSQMMSQEMMRDMSGLMRQMSGQMQQLQQLMNRRAGMDLAGQRHIAQMVDEMSTTMHEMAADMAPGKMDPGNMHRMQERMKRMEQMLKDMGDGTPSEGKH